MPVFSEDTIRQVRARTDIVDVISQYVSLEKHGKEFKGYIGYDDSYKSSYNFLTDYYKDKKPSRLVITFRDSQAIAVRNAANEAGWKSMEDYEVISILDSKYLAMVRPPINSYMLPEYDMGAIAMRLLTKMLVNDPSVQEDREIEIEYSPMIREKDKKGETEKVTFEAVS